MSSNRMDWKTPPEVVLGASAWAWGQGQVPDIDAAAADSDAAVVPRFICPEQDALSQDWPGKVWLNPPYGGQLSRWIEKAYEESTKDASVLMLIPSRTDTRWFQRIVWPTASKLLFLGGRIKFLGAPSSAPFPSMLVFWENGKSFSRVPVVPGAQSVVIPPFVEALHLRNLR